MQNFNRNDDNKPKSKSKQTGRHPDESVRFLKNINDALKVLNKKIETINIIEEQALEKKNQSIESEIKIHESITTFFNNLKDSLINSPKPSGDNTDKEFPFHKSRYTKQEVIKLIQTMYEQGYSIQKIAEYLERNQIPTFSGRGKWFAQTVWRFCK